MKNSCFTWEDFKENFGKEMACSEDVFNNMKKDGLEENSLAEFDFNFISDSKEKLTELSKRLNENYQYEIIKIIKTDDGYDMEGKTYAFPVSQENLMYWALHMLKIGYEYDAKFDAYGAMFDPKKQIFPNFMKSEEDKYFDNAVDCYKRGDLSGAIFEWNKVIKINPKEVNSFYSLAIVKNELYTWRAALRDYNTAIEIAPKFVSAIINRASLKDENGDYERAINDYNIALEIEPKNEMAYFNRGNTKYNLGDEKGAIIDWEKAKKLGADYAEERIKKIKK